MNRLVIFNSDHSEQRTKAVIRNIKNRYTSIGMLSLDDYLDYKAFFKSLKPYSVVIPYVDEIKFDAARFETRRSSKIFMDLLSTVALLNQHNRQIDTSGVLISQKEDFNLLCSLISKECVSPKKLLSPSQLAVQKAIWRLSEKSDFTYRDILEAEPLDDDGKIYELSSVKKAVQRLQEFGLVELVRNGKPVYFRSKEKGSENSFGVFV